MKNVKFVLFHFYTLRYAFSLNALLELHLTTSELWFGQEQEGILP